VRARKGILMAAAFVVAVAAALLILSWAPEALRRQAESRASDALGVEVSVGRVRLGRGPTLEITEVSSGVVSVARIRISLELLPLLRRRVVIHELVVDSLRVTALPLPPTERRLEDGGGRWSVELRRFEVRDADVQLRGGGIERVDNLFASGRYSFGATGHHLDLAELRCLLAGPNLQVLGAAGEFLHLSGGLTSVRLALRTTGNRLGLDAAVRRDTGTLRLSVAAPDLDLTELTTWVGPLPIERGDLRLDAEGTFPDVRFTGLASLGDSVEMLISGQARLDRADPRVFCAGKGRFVGSAGGAPARLSVLFCGALDGTTPRVVLHTMPGSRWGEYPVSPLTLSATMHDSILVVAGRAATGSPGDLTFAGRGCLGSRRRVDSSIAFHAVDPAVYGGPPGSLTGEASLGFASRRSGIALLRLSASTVGGTGVDRLDAAAVLAPGTVEIGGLMLDAPWGSVAATGRWHEGDVRARAVAQVDSLQHLSQGAPVRGLMSALVSVDGQWPRWAGEAVLVSTGITYGDAGFESLAGVCELSGVAQEVGGRMAVLGRNGRVGWLQIDSVLVFGEGRAAASRYVLKLDGEQAMLHLSGRSRDRTLLLSGAQLRLGDVRFQTTRPWKVSFRPDGVALDTLSLAALGCSLTVQGVYGAGRGHGSIELVGLDLSRLASLAPALATASGDASLRGVFEGPPWNGSGTLIVRNGEYRGAGLSLVSADVTAAEGKATIQSRIEQRGVERLRLTGAIVGQDWTARIVIQEPDLSAVPALVPGLARLSGALQGDLLVQGSGPVMRSTEGEVRFSDGLVRVEPLNQDFTGVRLTVTSQGEAWTVSDLSAQSEGGRATGWLSYDRGKAEGHLALERLPLRGTVGGAGVLDGSVQLSSPEGAPHVSGKITLREAQVLIDELASRGTPGGGPGALTLPPWADPARGEVTVAIPRNCWIRSSDLEVEIGGELRVTKEGNVVQLWGDVETLRGSYRFQGKVFTVTKGRVSFTGSEIPDPALEVEARHRLRDRLTGEDITVFVDLTGTATAPVVALRSEPPMEELDILSYLLMGRPSSELVAAEQNALVRSVSGLLAGRATQRLARSVGEALGFDTFEIETVDAPALRLGSYLSGRVYFEYTQELKRDGARGIRLDYHLGRGFSLEATSTTLGETGLDLVWSREF
jgi:hypothetical protein